MHKLTREVRSIFYFMVLPGKSMMSFEGYCPNTAPTVTSTATSQNPFDSFVRRRGQVRALPFESFPPPSDLRLSHKSPFLSILVNSQ